jgi:hypothetical protein
MAPQKEWILERSVLCFLDEFMKGGATMTQATSSSALEQRWRERVQTGTFSAAVLGIGTIRIMGRSGDAPVQFPRIASLDALDLLEEDEQYAVRTAQQIIAQAHQQQRTVFAIAPASAGSTPSPRPVQTFDPSVESLMVVARIAGG